MLAGPPHQILLKLPAHEPDAEAFAYEDAKTSRSKRFEGELSQASLAKLHAKARHQASARALPFFCLSDAWPLGLGHQAERDCGPLPPRAGPRHRQGWPSGLAWPR